jgi:hypothetical protein
MLARSLVFPRRPLVHHRSPGVRLLSDVSTLTTQIASVSSQVAFGLLVIQLSNQRPRGWLTPGLPLVVKPSGMPGAGRGLFAGTDMPAGSILGAYAGRVIRRDVYQRKLLLAPSAAEYCWQLSSCDAVLDPTDRQGKLCEPLPLNEELPAWLPGTVPTTLALINEPAPGWDVNVDTFERGWELTFALNRDVLAGEELFLDYGPMYDRSSYAR